MRLHPAPAIAAVLLTAACASTTHPTATGSPTAPAAASSAPATTPAPPSSSAAASSTAGPGSNISLSGSGKALPPGPFQITAVSCGPYTKAQQDAFATAAKGGLVYRYANASNSLTGAPSLSVDFADGDTVLGDNVSGGSPDIGPGQKAEGHVDAVGQSGQNLAFSSCELMQYGVRGTTMSGFAP